MHDQVAAQLLRLNREFYQTFGPSFAETRARLQPGVARALRAVPPEAAVLDLGCGHGLLARALADRGHRGPYLGLDVDEGFVAHARRRDLPPWFAFAAVDLSAPRWSTDVSGPFDEVFAMAVVHHLPTTSARQRFMRRARSLMGAGVRFTLSVWDFRASERLRARIVPWSAIGLSEADVDPGDALIDWRRGGHGLRYVHRFDEDELDELAAESGFDVVETYRSDGEGGRLGLYQVWRPSLL